MRLVEHFLFERMVAVPLVRLAYFGGVIVVLGLGWKLGLWLLTIGQGLWILAVVAGLPIVLIFWRLLCEGWIVVYGIYDRLGEIRDRLPPLEAEGGVSRLLPERHEPLLDADRAAAAEADRPQPRRWEL